MERGRENIQSPAFNSLIWTLLQCSLSMETNDSDFISGSFIPFQKKQNFKVSLINVNGH